MIKFGFKLGLKHGLMLAGVLAAALPMHVFAAEGHLATFDIKVEDNKTISEVSPVLNAPISKGEVAFRIINNTSRGLFFPVEGKQRFVPLVTNNTIVTTYTPGQQYSVVDADGATVATWTLDQVKIQPPNVTSLTASQFEEMGNTLHRLIENQRVSYQEPPAKPEPRYYEHSYSRVSKGGTVRGYW